MHTQGQPRTVEVPVARLERWLDNFAARHGAVTTFATSDAVTVSAADGSVAVVTVPFAPLRRDADAAYAGLLAHVARERRIGVLLVRRGGYAAGVFVGARLVASKVGSRHVQGRSAAGGWSQQRFARRRDQQAREAAGAAADAAFRVLVPEVATLHSVVTGGDKDMVGDTLEDRRLAVLRPLVATRVLAVADPRKDVLVAAGALLGAVTIEITDPWTSTTT